ncbi:N-acetyldiaminopimelate deacetylase [Salisediminibacterium halotolerans]|uniref:N-acetyldiaminopimelate deacetylase n=1 Tax=Salisediminibacterium halotolerans TaxID=517425 RepID=UPI000F128BAA|nr:N-acetyldiaminopimelate deacetylase [Salisediminibacterium halotolerans]RLJ74369.1 N-acetyldiaminopimelate deacetylase [Actinophytocola xinjiangensis]RPE87538.1 N-acetyldiaminopimelate deacetylase [Salisediminibacterium halotolerans]TWG35206.1 N-acetyldiaminopimelate deacetylase [Salisediminibacterium halotolerans]GEL08162.1 N-acetyldiaminopimelate deacetylase [Salisediminibacterium halotolerans]
MTSSPMMTERLANYRRALHQIPEKGFEEYKTQRFILNTLAGFPQDQMEVVTWHTGVLVKIHGTDPVKTVGYRTDMDGLPMEEETALPFKSEHPGMMHACGHDMHMAIALTLVEHFASNPARDHLLFIFQPAEEGPGGAKPMLDSEPFQRWQPDEMYALHIAPEYPVKTVAVKPGILFANTSELFIDLYGQGGHAAYPHKTEDMVVAASYFVTQLQTVVARNVPPLDAAVVTIGKITGGSKQNIIADHARLEGTIRTLSLESMNEVKSRIESLCKGTEASFRCRTSIDYGANYCQVYNDEELSEQLISAAENSSHVSYTACDKAMTGEDFGYFLEKIPGAMFWLGVNSEHGLHSSKLNADEEAMEPAVNFLIEWINGRTAN